MIGVASRTIKRPATRLLVCGSLDVRDVFTKQAHGGGVGSEDVSMALTVVDDGRNRL